MVDGNPVQILVAEDDNFQRLALIDILELCDYEVIAVENGKIAQDELLNEDNNFDLVLLDLMMPEMDGLELLIFMKNNDKLKDIPVIIMSSDGEMESVATCMSHGARDYLIKPIRIGNVKNLATHINRQKKKGTDGGRSLNNYQNIRLLGKGSAGSVQLVRSNADDQLYALKTIELKLMSPHERKLAENEVTLLKVLKGPTIIRYYESFTQNETIYIVMECAEGGSLSDRVTEKKAIGDPIPNQQVLDWTAQLVMGIMLMHSKNILHRDIKTQNMFLTKNDIVKLGDFGISKALGTQSDFAKTYCGTPYFMSPEVCRGEVYNQKSDIWALGCALYEISALKKPFDHNNIPGLINLICEKEPDPLPEHLDPKIKMLIYSMLQKDATKRPTIWEVAQYDCVKEAIKKFVIEHDCQEAVEGVIDFKKNEKKNEGGKSNDHDKSEHEDHKEETIQSAPSFPFPMDKLDELASTIRNNIKLRSVKTGYFKVEEAVIDGNDLFDWFKTHLNYDNLEFITKVCNNLIDQNLIYGINTRKYEKSNKMYYRFQRDKPGLAINMNQIFKGQARPAIQLAVDIVAKMNDVIKDFRSEPIPGEVQLDFDKLNNSKNFKEFQTMICELQSIQFNSLTKNEILTFFLNMYQVMHVHKVIRDKQTGAKAGGVFSRIMSLFRPDPTEMTYNLGQLYFGVEDIKHGILRNNKKSPSAYFFKNLSASDSRANLVHVDDPRVVLVLLDENQVPKRLETFTSKDTDEKLDKHCKNLLSSTVIYDPNENELIIPNIFKTYKGDFGNQKDLINFILKFNKFTSNPDEVHSLIKQGKFMISYGDD